MNVKPTAVDGKSVSHVADRWEDFFDSYRLRWPQLQRSEVLFCCLMCHRVSEGMHLTCIPVSLYFRLYAIIT